jgi:hypothetical protein
LLSKRRRVIIPVGNLKVDFAMKEKSGVLQGTLALMSSRHSMSWGRSTAGELPDASSRSAETF